jgi:hypothetical protein
MGIGVRHITFARMQSLVGTNPAQGQNRRSYKVKLKTWTASIAALVLSTAPVFAVNDNVQWSDSLVRPASCDTGSCDPGCCDPVDCGDPCCGSGVSGGGLLSGIGGGCVENFSLAGLLGIDECSCIEIGGWTQMGWTDNNDGVFNTHPDHLDLQQQWFYFGKTVDGSNGLDLGGRVDFLYGTDASNTQAFGNDPGNWDYQNGWDRGVYGYALPQAYVEAAYGDLSVKVGHFFTLLGYQVVPATGNFFYSIPYTFNFSEAFTHTGVLTTYTGFEGWTFYNGWTLGWDTGYDQSTPIVGARGRGNSYLGGFSVDVTDDVNVTYINTFGDLGWIGDDDNAYTHSIVANCTLTDKLSYVFQSDMVDVQNSVNSLGGRYDTIGINQYLFYTINDVVKSGARVEWWKADGHSLYEMAYGLNIQLLDNLLMRPEYRYNWAPAGLPAVLPVVSTTGNSTSVGDYTDQSIVGCDFILTF